VELAAPALAARQELSIVAAAVSARSRARAEALAGQSGQSGRCGKPSPGMVKMLEESMEEFEELTKTLVIIDFTASWCGGP